MFQRLVKVAEEAHQVHDYDHNIMVSKLLPFHLHGPRQFMKCTLFTHLMWMIQYNLSVKTALGDMKSGPPRQVIFYAGGL